MGGGHPPHSPRLEGGREGPCCRGGLCFPKLPPPQTSPLPPKFPLPLPCFPGKIGTRASPPPRPPNCECFEGQREGCPRKHKPLREIKGCGGVALPPPPSPRTPAEAPSPAKRFPRITRRAEQGGCLKTQSRSPNEFNYNVVNTLPLRFN